MARIKIVVLVALLFVSSLGFSAAALPAPPKPTLKPPPPPIKPPPKFPVAVEGVIYCKSCNLPGYIADIDSSPIPGAVAKLQCNVTAGRPYEVTGKTDKNGYFFIAAAAPAVSSLDAGKCKVFLVSSPLPFCKTPSDYNGGVTGAKLVYEKNTLIWKTTYSLYTAGILQFGVAKAGPLPKYCHV